MREGDIGDYKGHFVEMGTGYLELRKITRGGCLMVDNKKEQERDELHHTIWSMANDLSGSVDGWDFKQYVLGMLFYCYISENFVRYVNAGEIEAENTDFDYVKLNDKDAEDRDSEKNFKGSFDDIDINSNKLGGTVAKRNEKLAKLSGCVGDMLLRSYQDNTIDAFGDAYDGFFGQEINITTYNLCRMNMWLHDIEYTEFDIGHGDTLIEPMHWCDESFEAIVSNPPYSIKWEGDDNPILINDERFSPAGVLAPKSKADLASIMHSLSWLATNGVAAIVCFPGVMYRGGAEQKIRKYLIDNIKRI